MKDFITVFLYILVMEIVMGCLKVLEMRAKKNNDV